jgi:Zn-dependent protease with chaperone function
MKNKIFMEENTTMDLLYKNERPLFIINLVLSVLFWVLIIFGTAGIILIWILLFFISYLFVQSGLIAYLKGTAVKITPNQFPDLYKQIRECCRKLDIIDIPEVYMLHADGMFNAFATKFLRKHYVVLLSDVVDALEGNEGAIKFYFGHELGHIHRDHLFWGPILFPASLLPLLGAAYSRAREYTCDNYGFACCNNPQDAVKGLAVLATGGKRHKTMSIEHYARQTAESGGFWMSFHELTADYPWLVKRMASIASKAKVTQVDPPQRHPLAWLLAMCVPRTVAGTSAASILIAIAVIGIIAAIAIPNFIAYRQQAEMRRMHPSTQQERLYPNAGQ